MLKEKLLYSPTCWSYARDDGSDGATPIEITNCCYADAMAHRKRGDIVRSFAGSPGTGYIDSCITRMDATGIYGVTVVSTVRELTAAEVV